MSSVPSALMHAVRQFPAGAMRDGAAVWASMLGPGQWFGELIRKRQAAAVVGDGACRTLFVHAGLLPDVVQVLCSGSRGPERASHSIVVIGCMNA
jgi:hypothetical protein